MLAPLGSRVLAQAGAALGSVAQIRAREDRVKTVTKWMVVGAGATCASLVCRAVVGNAAGVVAAVLSDFEARRTDVPMTTLTVRKTARATSTKLPPRLKADIAYARSAAAKQTITLDEEQPAPIAR